jgi:endonuclease/exonuclease/phosphatase (EEP) superfamily protein YafD
MPKRSVRIALQTGLVAVGLLWLLGRAGPTGFPPTVLASYAPPAVYLLPVAAIVAASAVLRRRQLAAVAAVSLAALVYAEGARLAVGGSRAPVVSAAPDSAVPSAPRFRVMTYNVGQWGTGATAIARVVASADADVVCLEEAGRYPWLTDPDETPEALARALPAYRIVGDAEVRIASRLPIRESRALPLPPGPLERPLEIGVVDAGGYDVSVAAVHFIPTLLFQSAPRAPLHEIAEGRMRQAERVLESIDAISGPVVLCGDFNAPPTAAPIRRIASRLHDAWDERGLGFGWTEPTNMPYARIDYVFVRGLRVDDVAVGCQGCDASDHLPVITTLAPP